MKIPLYALVLILSASYAMALTPKMLCESKKERNRYFKVAIIYSPLNQLTRADVTYVSEYGVEPVAYAYLKRPGYTPTGIYFNEQPLIVNLPGSSTPPSIDYQLFKMVLDKSSLTGTLEFAALVKGNIKNYKMNVSCHHTQL